MLERWVDEVSADSFAEDVSSKGVKAWAVRHEAGVQHQDVLVERLRRIISNWRRCDGLREFGGDRWARRLNFRLLNRTTAARGAGVMTALHRSRRRLTGVARGGDQGGATATLDSGNRTLILTYVRTHV